MKTMCPPAYHQNGFVALHALDLSKNWKKPKYNSFRNKCLIFDIYIDIFADDIQSYIYILVRTGNLLFIYFTGVSH